MICLIKTIEQNFVSKQISRTHTIYNDIADDNENNKQFYFTL